MKIEVIIDRTKKLPDGTVPALEQELSKRISQSYSDCKFTVRRAGADGLSIIGGEKGDKARIEEILQETMKARMTGFVRYSAVGVGVGGCSCQPF